MWLSSEMVDSYFIRAIVCSGQKEPKKNKTVRETRSTKVKIGANIYSTQSQSAWFHISGQAYGTKVTNISWIKSRHQQNSKPEGNCIKKKKNCWQNSCITQIWRRKLFLGCILGLRWYAGLRLFYAARGVKFEKWKWNLRSESENLKVKRGEEEIISENKAFKVFDPIMILLNEIESKYDFWGWLIFATARIETKSQSENCVGN